MKISLEQKLPHTTLYHMTPSGPKNIILEELTAEKKVVLVGMPGAFTQTCTSQHLPSLVKNSASIFSKGIDEIICIVVNDVHVAKAWGELTGATEAGIKILCDVEAKFAIEIGLSFSVPQVGFFNRLQRLSIILNNNLVKFIQVEQKRGECELTSGETLLDQIDKIFVN